MDVIPLDASLIKGSHGCIPPTPEMGPLLISKSDLINGESIKATDVCQLILQHLQVSQELGVRS
jgi:hypothetical protein